MTGYRTAERTATTPLSVPATPRLTYPLVLIALLAADVLLTVHAVRLGLPELNPLLAPIAESVAAQVAYKAPFAVALLAGTALLAAACDRLVSGAGRYPWLAVAGIYAIPVGWNLVVIAQHTGFQAAPGVVYAAVAIVCVWQTVITMAQCRREIR